MSFSVKLSVLLEECNIVKLKPRFKKGSKSDPQRYRPISPLPPVSKVIEKWIRYQLKDFLRKMAYSTAP